MNPFLHPLSTARRRMRTSVPASFVPGVRPMAIQAPYACVEALLCERLGGGFVLVKAAAPRPDGSGGLLTLGRVDVPAHHLCAETRAKLAAEGQVDVRGTDAANLLLAMMIEARAGGPGRAD